MLPSVLIIATICISFHECSITSAFWLIAVRGCDGSLARRRAPNVHPVQKPPLAG